MSSEKNDMECTTRAGRTANRVPFGAGEAGLDTDGLRVDLRVVQATVDEPLRCVSSGYLADGCSCESRIPAAVVVAAWRHQLEQGQRNGGFFQFAWRGEKWLAYGLDDGRIRGVYCPTHHAAREERSAAPGDDAAPIALSA
jgi:hypothetical protein